MPLYEYECTDCGTKEDMLVPVDERDKQVCERCKKLLVRLVSKPGKPVWGTDCPTASGGRGGGDY